MHSIKPIIKKQTSVYSIEKSATITRAAVEMADHNIGSLVVTDGNQVVGIITERDCLKRVLAARLDPEKVRVADVMTSPVAVCRPDTSIEECIAVITEKRIRHLPVVDNGKLVGIVTSGDILAQQMETHEETIEYLNQYIYGPFHKM
ncbi:MAG: CBS domain-containing protein [Planctomycetota bacterium]